MYIRKLLYAILFLHWCTFAFSNNTTKLPSNIGDISSLLKNYSAIKIDATADVVLLGDNMSEIKKSKSELVSSLLFFISWFCYL